MTIITSKEFTELKAFKAKHSLDPATWNAISRLAVLTFAGQTGYWMHPDDFMHLNHRKE